MKPHDTLFSNQEAAISKLNDAKAVVQDETFIGFEISGGSYALPITAVREISDDFSITPYPEQLSGHIGIVSLRGRVLPVIAPNLASGTRSKMAQNATKLLVLEFSDGKAFCIEVQHVRKFVAPYPKDHGRGTRPILNIRNHPVQIISETDLIDSKTEIA